MASAMEALREILKGTLKETFRATLIVRMSST
jgi:hypothetical protein